MQRITEGEDRRDITVVRAGALGDVILTLPAVEAIRNAFPHVRLRVVGYPENWTVAGTLVDSVLSIDRTELSGLLTPHRAVALQEPFRQTRGVVAWTQHDPTTALHAVGVEWVAHARPDPPLGIHASRLLLNTVTSIPGISVCHVDPARWRLTYSSAEQACAQALLQLLGPAPYALVHAGAGAAWKRWSAERFATVASVLRSRGFSVGLVQGPADEGVTEAVQAQVAIPFPVLPHTGLRVLGAALSLTHLFVGNDSGISHLAGASGATTIALFGPTDPAQWKPLGQTTVVRRCTVVAQTDTGIRVCHDPHCMDRILVGDVLEAIDDSVTVQSSTDN